MTDNIETNLYTLTGSPPHGNIIPFTGQWHGEPKTDFRRGDFVRLIGTQEYGTITDIRPGFGIKKKTFVQVLMYPTGISRGTYLEKIEHAD